MGSQRKIRIFAILTAAMLVVILTTAPRAAVYQLGSRGDTVRTIQTKLKRWGSYNGSADGVYGKKTAAPVRLFQQKNGLTVDGVAGPKTLAAIMISKTIMEDRRADRTRVRKPFQVILPTQAV